MLCGYQMMKSMVRKLKHRCPRELIRMLIKVIRNHSFKQLFKFLFPLLICNVSSFSFSIFNYIQLRFFLDFKLYHVIGSLFNIAWLYHSAVLTVLHKTDVEKHFDIFRIRCALMENFCRRYAFYKYSAIEVRS